MKKSLLLSLLMVFVMFTCLAQNSHPMGKFSIGIEGGIPTSDYDSYYMTGLYKYGIGGSLKFDIPTSSPNLYVTLSGGFTTFKTNEKTSTMIKALYMGRVPTSEDFAPLKVGLKYYMSKGFFGEAQAGMVVHTGRSVEFISDGDRSFLYSPGIGYSFDNGIEVGARYESWRLGGTVGNMSQLGIRIAYAFKLP
jgi:hypothetical protein